MTKWFNTEVSELIVRREYGIKVLPNLYTVSAEMYYK